MTEIPQKQKNRTKRGLIALGFLFSAAGLVCTIVGSTSFFSALGSGKLPLLFWLLIAGLPMMTIGASLLTFGLRRELPAQVSAAEQTERDDKTSAPVSAVADNADRPAEHDAAQPLSGGNSVRTDANASAVKICPKCGAENDSRSRYCGQCGAAL